MISSSPPRARPHPPGDLDDVVVVEVEPRHGEVRLRLPGLFLDRHGPAVRAELHDAEVLGIADLIGEDRGARFPLGRHGEHPLKPVPVEDVVAEHQRHPVIADEVAADHEGLRESLRPGLLRIRQREAERRSVAEQLPEVRQVVGRGDHEDVAHPRQHQRRQWVVDHRLVVDRQELLRQRERHGVQPRPGAAGQHDSLEWMPLLRGRTVDVRVVWQGSVSGAHEAGRRGSSSL